MINGTLSKRHNKKITINKTNIINSSLSSLRSDSSSVQGDKGKNGKV